MLSFKRMEQIRDKAEGASVLVCNVVLRPIAGHRANSMIMKYVAGRRDMEIAASRVPVPAGAGFAGLVDISV